MPPHELILKVGSVVMLLRNMSIKHGLCNGTRLVVKKMMPNVIDCEIIMGKNLGERVFLPRIDTTSQEGELPFILKRRQFPVRVSFAMTINKSQGQTFDFVGLNLSENIFSHGQLYVALSRVQKFSSLKIFSKETPIPNIVFKEVI